MLKVSVRLSRFMLLNLKRSDISNGRIVVMIAICSIYYVKCLPGKKGESSRWKDDVD